MNAIVPNQDNCGSCWAFAVTGAIEGQYFRKSGKMVPLSVQNLVDCAHTFGYDCDCHGGYLDKAYKYVRDNGGINKASVYPYEAAKHICNYKQDASDIMISTFKRIPSGDEEKLKEAIATIGPISVSIDASSNNFDHYRSGIYSDPDCQSSSSSLDHSVLLVGYGTTANGEDYYIAKNW